MLKNFKSPVLRQYGAVVIANLSILSLGYSVGWPSPTLVKFRNPEETIFKSPLTEDQEAWIASIAIGAGCFALPFIGTLLNYLGRRNLLIYMAIPRLIQCLLKIFANEFWIILLARSVGGIADILSVSATSTYAAEVANKNIRGASGTVTQIISAAGMMIVLAVGPFVSYLVLNLVFIALVVVTFIPLLFIPESPFLLYSKGRTQDAIDVLVTLRGSKELAQEEINEYSTVPEENGVDKISLLKNRAVIKSFVLVIFLSISMQWIGYQAVILYLQAILDATKTSVDSGVASLIIGLIQLLACIFTFMLTDKFGRKPLLCISLLGMFIGQIGIGTFFVFLDGGREITGFLNFLPLLSIAIIIYGYNAGMGSLFYILVAELFEGPLRAYGLSCAIFLVFLLAFLLVRFFPIMITSLGAAAVYYAFAVGCAVTSLVIFQFVPETKGRTFTEIQTALGREDLKVDVNVSDKKDQI